MNFCAVDKDYTVAAGAKKVTWNCKVDQVATDSNGALQQPLRWNSSWSAGGVDDHGVQQNSSWPLGGNHISGLSSANPPNQPPLAPIPKGWQNGDRLCNLGFHNYSSRAQCKKCIASSPPEPSHGEMEIGCAQIATIITTHLDHGATGVRRKETWFLSQSMSYSCEFPEDLEVI
uniref:RanBP2-type domain-containing protein n=1 Tax=Populus alba TaxID=43335 RepID=A0A4U5Q171_POPAL|nr:hypothetical protein D5086_0000165860 [Populus alba]